MKTINATLLANQKTPIGAPFATLALADNTGLHPTSVATATWSGSGNTVGCECGTFYFRARYLSTGINVQKITDPTIAAQWNTWSGFLAAGNGTTYGIAIFWTGTYIVIAYQEFTVSGDIKYYRSGNGGVSWSSIGVAHAGSSMVPINISGVSGGSSHSGLVLSYANGLHFQQYNDGTDTFAAADDPGITLTDVVPQVAGFYDTINSRYILAIESNKFTSWAAYAIVLFTRAANSATWSAGQVVFGGNNSHYRGLAFAQRQVNGLWWFSFSSSRIWTTSGFSNFFISASNDGLFWQDPLITGVLGSHITLEIYPAPSGGTWTNAYMATEAEALRFDVYAYWSSTKVVSYHFNSGHGAASHDPMLDEGPTGGGGVPNQTRLVIRLDNRDAALTAPRLFTAVTLTRGLVINNVQYGQSAGAYYLLGYRYVLNDNELELHCTDAHGLLASWFSHNVFTFAGQTVKQLVEVICALAGIHTVTFDASTAWTDTVSAFAHPVKKNAHFSLRALSRRVPFEFIAKEDGSLYFYVPTASPASVYTYGGTPPQHVIWPGSFGGRDSVTHVQVMASPPTTEAYEAFDQQTLYDHARTTSMILNQRSIFSDPGVIELTNFLLVAAQERRRAGVFEAPPNFALEPGDVISFGSGPTWASGFTWRVVEFEEHFNDNRQKAFYQKITVRGTAP